LALAFGLGLSLPGCATLREVAALRQVEFSIDRVADVRLAGVDLTGVGSYDDLGAARVARVGAAVLQKRLPLQFDLHLRALNPAHNAVSARLVGMEWTLLLQDQETIRGSVDGMIMLPPGEPQDIPIAMRVDLLEFFASSTRDLVNLALAATGRNATRTSLALRAVPSIETPLGPLRYPEPITILRREFAGAPPGP
jgi:hypothetical protein